MRARALAVSENDGFVRRDVSLQFNREIIAIVSIARRDGVLMAGDLARDRIQRCGQRFHLLAQVPPARTPHAVEPFELRQFNFRCDLFQNFRIAAGDGFDLRGGHHQLIYIFGGARRHLARHDLADEAGLRFKRLPHVAVKRVFRDVGADMNVRKDVSLSQNSAFALLDVRRTPRRIEMVERVQPLLHIHARTSFLRRGEQDAKPARIGSRKGFRFLFRGREVVNESNLVGRNATLHERAFEFAVNALAGGNLCGGFLNDESVTCNAVGWFVHNGAAKGIRERQWSSTAQRLAPAALADRFPFSRNIACLCDEPDTEPFPNNAEVNRQWRVSQRTKQATHEVVLRKLVAVTGEKGLDESA